MNADSWAPLDSLVVGSYVAGIVFLSARLAFRQRTGTDYFLAGRSFRGRTLAASILANQASAVSLVGAPAFVALKEGGGLVWLQYELALPLAMLAIGAWLLPVLRGREGASIYAWLEDRFGRRMRRTIAAVFLVSRGLAVGVILYASSLVVAEVGRLPLAPVLVTVGLLSVGYTSLGGLAADVWSDVIQLVLLWLGTLAAGFFLFAKHGAAILRAVPTERMAALSGSFGLPGEGSFGLAPMLVGGFFLYMSYYGCDQSQAQRLLAASSDEEARKALLWNGLVRFPLVFTYCGFGLLLAGLIQVDGSFALELVGKPTDSLVPVFIRTYLPAGLRGLFVAAILAAAMSSIDSALNSLAAVSLEDLAGRSPERQSVWLGRVVSLGWGLFAVASGLFFARAGTGILELINQIGSLVYGPVLAVFLLGALARSVSGRAALFGFGAGLTCNLALARFLPSLSWLWWNPAGFAAAFAVSVLAARSLELRVPGSSDWKMAHRRLLLAAFLLSALSLGALTALSR